MWTSFFFFCKYIEGLQFAGLWFHMSGFDSLHVYNNALILLRFIRWSLCIVIFVIIWYVVVLLCPFLFFILYFTRIIVCATGWQSVSSCKNLNHYKQSFRKKKRKEKKELVGATMYSGLWCWTICFYSFLSVQILSEHLTWTIYSTITQKARQWLYHLRGFQKSSTDLQKMLYCATVKSDLTGSSSVWLKNCPLEGGCAHCNLTQTNMWQI